MSKLAQPIVNTLLDFYSRLARRVVESSVSSEFGESARADAAVAALDFLRLEREARLDVGAYFDDEGKALTDEWRKRVQSSIDGARRAIAAVESEDERSYLRRALLTSILELSSTKRDFLFRESVEELLDALDDSEREIAVYTYALFLARRLMTSSVDEIEATRVRIAELCEETEDQYEYEHVTSLMALATSIGLERAEASELSESNSDAEENPRDDDLFSRTIVDFSALETEEGTLRYYNETFVGLLDELSDARLKGSVRDHYAGLKSIITGIEETLCTGVRSQTGRPGADEEEDLDPLDEDELQELHDLLADLALDAPGGIKDGAAIRAFVERREAYGTIETMLARVQAALETASADADDPNFARKRLVYTESREFYEAERAAWIELAERMARDSALEPAAKAFRLARSARIEFLYGDPEKGKTAAREALAIVPSLGVSRDAVELYRKLTEIHLEAKKVKPARKLAETMDALIDRFDESVMIDYLKGEAFPLYLRLFDEDKIASILDSFDADLTRRRYAAFASIFDAMKEYKRTEDVDELARALARIAADAIETVREEDPVVAASELRRIAEYVAERFAKLAKQADKENA